VVVVPTLTFPKLRLAGDAVAAGGAPVPLKVTVWGLATALSVMVTNPARVPLAVGVNVTLIVQLAKAATVPTQLSVSLKSPLAVIFVTVTGPGPLLLTVIVCAGLVIPMP
jgi:hypothetical protein